MSAIASPEFISLCQTQLRLLAQRLTESALAQSAAALYIADISELGDEPSNFVPVASYPGPVDSWVANFERATPWSSAASGQLSLPETAKALDRSASHSAGRTAVGHTARTAERTSEQPFEDAFEWPDRLRPEQQVVMPLVYTDVVVGLLIAVRPGRPWLNEERRYIELVAKSLAGGCVLERRNQWLQSQLAHKNGLQSRQSEVFHNLLHQFRNPLTAVSTFGQLLVKRLELEDPNQSVATGIVRENKRLRELVSHFDEAVAIGDADLAAETPIETVDRGVRSLKLPASQLAKQPLLLTAERSAGQAADRQGISSEDQRTSLGHQLAVSAQYLPDIVGPVLAVAGIVAAEKGVDLHTQVASDTPFVWGEEEALGEVVSNLVDNAIKYSAPLHDGRAEVWVQTGVSRDGEGSHYQGIVVGDTGPGIPAGDLEHLFERNYRGVQAEGDIPGTGLGLAIAQSLVSEMQGQIEVISPAVGTPWVPNALGASRRASSRASASASGPGTVFIVWLREVERALGSRSAGK